MILSQERGFLKSQEVFGVLCDAVLRAGEKSQRLDEVERELFAQLMELGRSLMQEFVNRAGEGNAGPTQKADDGATLHRSAKRQPRRYLSIFGELAIARWVYARRVGQKIESAPLDQKLGLPDSDFSYVLQDWQQRMCLKESIHESVTSLRELLGVAPSERAAEVMNQQMAERAESFRYEQPRPPANEEEQILVVTADGKGVPMRRPLEERVRSSSRRGKGEKANKKQMAYVGAVYSIAPFHRSADDVMDELRRREQAADRPSPQHKQVWVEMTMRDEEEGCTGQEMLFAELAVACHERNPKRRKDLICLMDGEKGLWAMRREWIKGAIEILDLLHVLERLWAVAHCFHAEKSREAEDFVNHRLRMLLEGKVGYVIGGLRRLLATPSLNAERRRTIHGCIRYYDNNRDRMKYDEYLAAGYPIGSGVAEGACRHVVKDRMEQTGMRWTINGAQAMLHLRAIYLNGDWNPYLNYRIEAEQTALYGQTAA
jgi:hypothetical protein